MKLLQSTIERLLYVVLLIIIVFQIVVYVKISSDDARKFHILKSNQDQIFCVIKAPQELAMATRQAQLDYINSCIRNNQ